MWTRNNIRQMIKEKYGIDIKLSTLGYYLARWGFTHVRALREAKQQMERTGTPILGCILNKVPLERITSKKYKYGKYGYYAYSQQHEKH